MGISSGRLSAESVVAAMRGQVLRGRCGCRRREESRAGVMIGGRAMWDLGGGLGDELGFRGRRGFCGWNAECGGVGGPR